jgi:hypothetical protein
VMPVGVSSALWEIGKDVPRGWRRDGTCISAELDIITSA